MPKRLTEEEVAFFHEEGYLKYNKPVMAQPKFDALKAHFEALLANWEAQGKSPESMDTPHFADPELFTWLLDDEVLDLVEDLIGPDIGLFSSHFICKPPAKGKRVPWHEDSAYWGTRIDPMEVVTIWLAIDPSTQENGNMQVIPRTHKAGYSEYESVSNPGEQVFATEIKEGVFDEADAVDMILAPNECSVHHSKMIHGSAANQGTMRRCGYTMRYFPLTSRYRPEAGGRDAFQVYHARGTDRAGNTFGEPHAVNEAWVAGA